MKTKRLFIIGNGFDLAHGIPSAFSQFGQYLDHADPTASRLIHDYLYVDKDFWNCFEERLASLDYDSVIDYAENFLVGYGADDWSDAYHHDFEYEIEQIVDGLSRQLRLSFATWIRSLQTPLPGAFTPVRCIDPTASFLSFNYTSTLQRLYGVPDANVTHIHGRSSNDDAEIIIGHGWERQANDLLSCQVDEETDVRVAGGYQLIDDYFAGTFKPTEQIIERHRPYFDSITEVSEICVLGHSLAEVDAAYFWEILDRIDRHTTQWTVSYHTEPTVEQERFSCFDVDSKLVRFVQFRDLQCPREN